VDADDPRSGVNPGVRYAETVAARIQELAAAGSGNRDPGSEGNAGPSVGSRIPAAGIRDPGSGIRRERRTFGRIPNGSTGGYPGPGIRDPKGTPDLRSDPGSRIPDAEPTHRRC